MLLARFWYLFLATAFAAAAAAALLAQSAVNRREEAAVTDNLQRDAAMVDTMLRLEARARLDRMAFITVDGKLGALLKQAAGTTDPKRLLDFHAGVKGLIQMQIGRIVQAGGRELEPDIAFAVDIDGRIVAQLGPFEANPPGTSLATFPLVRRALQGYVRDDVWVYDRQVYRMAARPVLAGGDYAGAVIHGYRLANGLLDKLTHSTKGATIAFFYDREVIGSLAPTDVAGATQPAELAAALASAANDVKFKEGMRSQAIALESGGRAVFDPIVGSAAALGVGYVVARPVHVLSSPFQLFQQASRDEVAGLPLPWLLGLALLLGLAGIAFLYIEADRHLKGLIRKSSELGTGDRDRLIVTDWRGAFRELADAINQAIERAQEKAGERTQLVRKKANLDDILGHTPESSVTPFFSFATDTSNTSAKGTPAAAAPAAVVAGPPGSGSAVAAGPPPGPAARPAPPAKAGAGPRPAARTGTLVGTSTLLGTGAAAVTGALASTGTLVGASPLAGAGTAAQFTSFSIPPPAVSARATDDTEDTTVVAPPPKGAQKAAKPAETSDGEQDDAHWREVYDAYIATRKQCGESIDNLTFEKFGVTLRKTRDQIVDKQGVKTVRFSVQVKDGKAALKALPIKR